MLVKQTSYPRSGFGTQAPECSPWLSLSCCDSPISTAPPHKQGCTQIASTLLTRMPGCCKHSGELLTKQLNCFMHC